MTDQPTPKPLTADEEGDLRFDADNGCFDAESGRRLFATLDATRLEIVALRESLAAAERERDAAKFVCGRAQDEANAEREAKKAARKDRDALAAELAEARKVVADVIRWLECGAEAMAKTARPGDSRFGEALAEVVAAIAARDSGKASGGGADAR